MIEYSEMCHVFRRLIYLPCIKPRSPENYSKTLFAKSELEKNVFNDHHHCASFEIKNIFQRIVEMASSLSSRNSAYILMFHKKMTSYKTTEMHKI